MAQPLFARSSCSQVRSSEVLASICFILFLFIPTSINEIQQPVLTSIFYSVTLAGIAAYLLFTSPMSKRRLVVALMLVGYLMIASIVAQGDPSNRLSVARVAPTIITAMFLVVNYSDKRVGPKFLIRSLDAICIAIIIWNSLTMMHIAWFEEFVIDFFTQLDDYTATKYSLLIGKPVFTFGVHNFASSFYLALFVLCMKVFYSMHYRRFALYLLVMAFYTFLLKSTSSYGTLLFMFAFVGYRALKSKNLATGVVLGTAMAVAIAAILMDPETMARFSREANGFAPRYFGESVYQSNYTFLSIFPLGAGFTIPDGYGVYFADSGFIIYLTMGNFIMPIAFLVLSILFFKANLSSEDFVIMMAILIFAELSFASLLYWKTMALYIIMPILLNSIPYINDTGGSAVYGGRIDALGSAH